jgi:hypothetical protein
MVFPNDSDLPRGQSHEVPTVPSGNLQLHGDPLRPPRSRMSTAGFQSPLKFTQKTLNVRGNPKLQRQGTGGGGPGAVTLGVLKGTSFKKGHG